ncbi:MAG: ABC transporter substrate-binding protein, partial [Candidatus Kariarchaeaceae archaeon]
MKKYSKLINLLVLALLIFSLYLPVNVKAQADENLVVITPHWEGIVNEFEAAFKTWYEDTYGKTVDIEWLDVGGTSDVVKYIDSNFDLTPEGIEIDIFWGGGVDPYIAEAELGHLEAYEVSSEVLNKIPVDFAGIPMYDSEYRWYGSAISGFGIVYNKALISIEDLPTPESWEDLTDPKLLGWVGSADPRHSGSTHMAYEIILQGYGWNEGIDLITKMGANIRSFPESSSSVPKSVGASEIAAGLAIDFYAWSEVSKHGADNIGYVMPEGLTVLNPDSIAILKGAPNLEVAQRFVEFVLSEKGQTLWMLPVGAEGGPTEFLLGRMCVIPDLYDTIGEQSVVPINPFNLESSLDYDAELGSTRWSFVNDFIGAMIIDSNVELVDAWEAIIEAEKALEEADMT